MLTSNQDETGFVARYRSYRLALVLLILPPLMLIEHLPALFDGSIDNSDLVALALGVLVPLLAAYLLIEIASFSFSERDNLFRWRWRNLLRHESLDLPLERVIGVRREAVEVGDSSLRYRLIVELDDHSIVGLTRGYSGYQDKQLEQIVEQIRAYLGHIVPMR
jgi:succinate dehydrogenase flavin-adding protein (antitoxin of CptAB toxin-antitoxin module)